MATQENGITQVILCCLIVFFVQTATAVEPEMYRIVFLNTKSIKIGDKLLKHNDVFDYRQNIYWSDARQLMRVVDVKDKQKIPQTLTPDGFKKYEKQGVRSLFDYLVQEQYLGTRDIGGKRRHYSSHKHYLADTLMLPVSTVADSTFRAEAFWTHRHQEIVTPLKLSADSKFYIITPEIYAGRKPQDIKLSIREINDELNWTNLIYRDIPIMFIPIEN